ncbi:hypothetical protein BDV93DRAFT_557945 [Ceratobasidium sp. AG-I]|nr:hypothetical protein BDV93DRAFT_557945 [Ceratobasidium sp. AG-I]
MSTFPRRPNGARLKDIFPAGFDEKFSLGATSSKYASSSRKGGHFSSKPEQLYYSLVERYDPTTPMESIMVKSAWYGKQTKKAQHEFIVIQVEDIDMPGLINYLVLDRNAENYEGASKALSTSTSQAAVAIDTFKVSYDGDIKRLLDECRLTPYKFLEELSFPSNTPLHLYEVVTLADTVSKRYPDYRLLDSSCYLYAAAIWECMHLMCPSAIYRDALAKKRGKCNWYRYIPSRAVTQETFEEIGVKLPEIKWDLWERRNAYDKTRVDEDFEEPE